MNEIVVSMYSYGYETWSLTLREEYRLRTFQKRVLRIIFESYRMKLEETA
jgi:hypothetical protein